MNDEDTTFSINLNEDYLTSTGSEYTFNMSDITIGTDNTITLDPGSSGEVYNILDNFIDPDRVEKMCKEYPALKKSWENFHAIYKMVDQDYKGNYEGDNVSF